MNSSDQTEIHPGDGVRRGTSITFTATPNAGYEVESWQINGIISPIVSKSLTEIVNEEMRVKVTFKPVYRTVTFSCNSEGGELSAIKEEDKKQVLTGGVVLSGTKLRFVAKPKDGWEVAGWQVNREDLDGSMGKLELPWVADKDLSVAVLFSKKISTEQISGFTPSVVVVGDILYIRNCAPQEFVSVYDMSGVRLYSAAVGQGEIDLSSLGADQTLVVRVGGVGYLVAR